MKIKATIHIHFRQWAFETKGEYVIYSNKMDDAEYLTYVGTQEIEVEVPEEYDPRPKKIAFLENQKQKVIAAYHKSVMEINDRISKLTALEFSAVDNKGD